MGIHPSMPVFILSLHFQYQPIDPGNLIPSNIQPLDQGFANYSPHAKSGQPLVLEQPTG